MSILESLAELVSDKEPTPNKFTIGMGNLIRQAREETGLSQAELGKLVFRRQATISSLENGKSEVGAAILTLLAAALHKPLSYFFPMWAIRHLEPDQLGIEEQELLTQFKRIWDVERRELAIKQVRSIAEYDTEKSLQEQAKYHEESRNNSRKET